MLSFVRSINGVLHLVLPGHNLFCGPCFDDSFVNWGLAPVSGLKGKFDITIIQCSVWRQHWPDNPVIQAGLVLVIPKDLQLLESASFLDSRQLTGNCSF